MAKISQESNLSKKHLLICTQAVDENDANLSFFLEWIEEFSKQCESVLVICLRKGIYTLPSNVTVVSLDTEKKLPRLLRAVRFLYFTSKYRKYYNAVFVHMNTEYVLLGGWLWHVWGKHISLWYTHKSVTWRLRIAVSLSNIVFSASQESFRLETKKLHIMGHGINTEKYQARSPYADTIRIITTGRISKTKRILEMLVVMDELYKRGKQFQFTIVGAPVTDEDVIYEEMLKREFLSKPYISAIYYKGAVPHTYIPKLLQNADVFLNLSTTGSMDKAILEAMSAGVVPITSNKAFADILPRGFFVPDATSSVLADRIESVRSVDVVSLISYVEKNHSLKALIPKILKVLYS